MIAETAKPSPLKPPTAAGAERKPSRAAKTSAAPVKAAPAAKAAEEPTKPGPAEHSATEHTATDAATDSITYEAAESLLEAKHLGARIKHLRQRKQMGLVELGRYTGLSASFLSQLETGRVVPTLRNLARIAMVFSRDLSYFFEPDEPELFRIIRAEDRHRLPQTGVDDPGYFYESLGQVPGFTPNGQKITPYIAEFLPSGETRPPRFHQHSGAEFLYVLSGQLKLTHDGKEDCFEQGDAVYFHADATHSYERIGPQTCTALILTMPLPQKAHR